MMDDEDLLAGIDLDTWRVPPPAAVHRPSLLVRALSPATPPKRPRMRWFVAAFAVVNIALAALVVILLARPTPTRTVTVLPAGGGSVDAQVRELLARLDREQRELEAKLDEIRQLRALVAELSEKVRLYERERTIEKRHTPTPTPTPSPTPAPVTPPPDNLHADCDEVSCVLMNYANGCCAKYRRSPATIVEHPASDIPETLDRAMITGGIARVKARISSCSTFAPGVSGKVKVRVRVDRTGRVTSVEVESTPDEDLGACVASAMQKATFARTLAGGSFSYPFVF